MKVGVFGDSVLCDLFQEELKHLIDLDVVFGVGVNHSLFDSDVDVENMLLVAGLQHFDKHWHKILEVSCAEGA